MRVTILILSLISACLATGAWKVSDVDRTVDLTTQIVKTSSLFTYENTDAKEQKDLLVAIPTAEAEKLSYMVIREDGQKNKLKITKQNVEKGFQLYKIDLSKAVAKGAQVKLKVEYRVTGVLSPYPTAIAQNQPQFIKAHLTSHVSAAYPVAKEKTTYKIPGNLVDNKNKENGKVVYGPYSDQPAFNAQFVDLHYECNFPFVVATVVERLIEVSHWGGNIAVEEYIELENKGADLKGTFSRLEHSGDRRGQSQRPHLQHFTTILPASAKDIYYRDEIGNISTSAIRIRTDSVELTVTPRFPLFGGWKTSYVIGYNVPSYEYLYNNGNNYALKMRVLDHIFENIVVEKLTTKVVLPEHVKNIKVNTPYTMDRRPDEVKASYLDTVGRQIVILQKDNLVSEHIQNFNISYDFEAIQLLREPVLVICFFFIIFFSIIVYVRLDFSLSSDPTSKIIEELSVIVRRLDALASRKSKLYTNFVDEITAFKESRDESALIEAKKQLDDGRHAVNSYISDLLTSAKPKFGEAAVKASELLKYDKPLFDSVDGYIAATIKSKQKTSPEDGKFAEKAVEARRKAEKIIDSLSSE